MLASRAETAPHFRKSSAMKRKTSRTCHTMTRSILALALGLALAGPALGQEAGGAGAAQAPAAAPDLPPAEIAERGIRAAAAVAVAQARLDAAGADRDRLLAGPHEFSVRAELQKRRTTEEGPNQTYNEWRLAMDRPIRLPGKADIDRRLGDQGVAAAEVGLGDGLHESARLLLDLWFAWLKADTEARLWREQVDLLQHEADLVAKREALGDAAKLELLQAKAAVGQARYAAGQAATRLEVARAELTHRFSLPLPATVPAEEPQPVAGEAAEWLQRILAHNHELAYAHAQTEYADLLAARAGAENTPDPTVGAWVASERGGEERLVGISIGMPIPGGARNAQARQAAAEATAARAMEEGIRQKVQAEAVSLIAAARASFEHWRDAAEAAKETGEAARLTARAHELGEAAMADVLRARGLANDARLAEAAARLDARRYQFRLLVDTHTLWDLDKD